MIISSVPSEVRAATPPDALHYAALYGDGIAIETKDWDEADVAKLAYSELLRPSSYIPVSAGAHTFTPVLRKRRVLKAPSHRALRKLFGEDTQRYLQSKAAVFQDAVESLPQPVFDALNDLWDGGDAEDLGGTFGAVARWIHQHLGVPFAK